MGKFNRIGLLLLTFVVCVSSFVFPAYADETYTGLNLLELSTPNDSGSFTSRHTQSSSDIWELPYTTNVSYVDFVVRTTGGTLKGVTISANAGFGSYVMQFLEIKPGLYRVFGSLGGQETSYLRLKFDFTLSSGASYFYTTYRQFSIDPKPYFVESITSIGWLDDFSLSPPYTQDMTFIGSPVQYLLAPTNSDDETFLATWVINDWEKYDFVEVHFSTFSGGIASITAFLGTDYTVVPVEYNVLPVESTDYSSNTFFFGTVRIDLRGLDRESDKQLSLHITGTKTHDQGNDFSTQSIKGFVYSEQPTGISALFINLKYWLFDISRSITNSIETSVGGIETILNEINNNLFPQGNIDQIEQDIQNSKDELEDIKDGLGSWEIPDTNIITFEIIPEFGNELFHSLSNALFNDPVVVKLLTPSMLFLLLGIIVG